MAGRGKKTKQVKICERCKRELTIDNFIHNDNTLLKLEPWCTLCRRTYCINLEKLQDYLKQNNRVFDKDVWKTCQESAERDAIKHKNKYLFDTKEELLAALEKKAVTNYMKLMNNSRYIIGKPDEIAERKKKKREEDIVKEYNPEMEEKWGSGYSPEQYKAFEKKYNRLIRSYNEKTEMHTEALLTYIRYRVQEEMATAKGDAKEAKQWGELASKAAQDAKINPSQMSKSDISGGVDVISQLFEAVESEVGIIPLLPKVLEQPMDDADMIIWCIVNYIRRLEEKPTIKYRDIWNFYDEMLQEYYRQNGFNKKQIEEYLKKRNNVFRDMEEIYFEPLYSQESLDLIGDDDDQL